MTLIHKDTHIEVRDQEILLASGLVADPIKPATQCLVDKPVCIEFGFLFHIMF